MYKIFILFKNNGDVGGDVNYYYFKIKCCVHLNRGHLKMYKIFILIKNNGGVVSGVESRIKYMNNSGLVTELQTSVYVYLFKNNGGS